MKSLYILIAIIFAIGIIASILAKKVNTPKGKKEQLPDFNQKWPYYKKRLLTKPEQILYFKLVEALPECLIFSQVQLSQILGVEKGNSYYEWYNRINRMSVDFVVCNKTADIIALIELDDSTHEQDERKEADRTKNKACADAGIRMIRWKVSAIPDRNEIRKAMAGKTA